MSQSTAESTPTRPVLQRLVLTDRAQDILKVLAIISMLIDHGARILLPLISYNLAASLLDYGQAIGRFAFPLFSLLIAYNLEQRRADQGRYIKQLLFFGVLAAYPYWQLFGPRLDVMFTLAIGVALYGYTQSKARSSLATLGVCLAAFLVGSICDYPLGGAFAVLIGAWVVRQPGNLQWATWTLYFITINNWSYLAIVIVAVPSIIDLLRRLPGTRFVPKYLTYAFYPVHLGLMLLARVL